MRTIGGRKEDDPGTAQPEPCTAPVLRIRGAERSYGGIQALRGVDFDLVAGEVHAVVGENGAGKSTLMKLLAGWEAPDRGVMEMGGKPVRFRGPHEALRRGIHLIHQELMPFPELSVAENLFAGHELCRGLPGWLDRDGMRRRAVELLRRVGLPVNPAARMGDLTVAQMQSVEVARALAHSVRVLIMDEPTSALSDHETERLFECVADLRGRGVAVAYISHKLNEVRRLADRITVLRDGRWVATVPGRGVREETLIQKMVGRELEPGISRARERAGAVLLEVNGLSRTGAYHEVSFRLHRGEVLGVAGLVGAGRTAMVSALYGLAPAEKGQVRLRGKALRLRHPADALGAGIAMVTEDRQASGLIPTMSVGQNLTLAALRKCCCGGWIVPRLESGLAWEWVQALRVRTADPGQGVRQLSGGNQQKVLLGRALMTRPAVLVLDEPTRGIDVGAKAEVYGLIRRLRDEGLGIVLVSSELPELLALSDRILVMSEGRVTGEVAAAEADEATLLGLCMPVAARGDRARLSRLNGASIERQP